MALRRMICKSGFCCQVLFCSSFLLSKFCLFGPRITFGRKPLRGKPCLLLIEDLPRELPGLFNKRGVASQVGKTKGWYSALLLAYEFSRSAQFQIGLGDGKPVGGALENPQALASDW